MALPRIEPKFPEVYSKFDFSKEIKPGELYKGPYGLRVKYGLGKEYNKWAKIIRANREVTANQGETLEVFMTDKGNPTLEKVWGGMKWTMEPNIPVVRGKLPSLAVQGARKVSAKTSVVSRCLEKVEDPYLNSKMRASYEKELQKFEEIREFYLKA